MRYVKINNTLYPAEIDGRMADGDWDRRQSKSITLAMSYGEAANLFVDETEWSIVEDTDDIDGNPTQLEYDNSDYCLAGDITDHRDGTVTVKMGKYTDLEIALMTGV